eukprot:scaffold19037_cov63-Phaeocystis_antarctica.AAC.5
MSPTVASWRQSAIAALTVWCIRMSSVWTWARPAARRPRFCRGPPERGLDFVQGDLDGDLAGDVGEGLQYGAVERCVGEGVLVLVVPGAVCSALVVECFDGRGLGRSPPRQRLPRRALVGDAPQLVCACLRYNSAWDDAVGDAGEVVKNGDEAQADHVIRLCGRRADAAVAVERQQVGHEHDLVLEVGVEAHACDEEFDELLVDAVGEELLGELQVDTRASLALFLCVISPERDVALAAA